MASFTMPLLSVSCVVLFATLVSQTSSFLIDSYSCPAPLPCRCPNLLTIYCNYGQLTDIPDFNETDRDYHHMEVYISHNPDLTKIDANAFTPLGHIRQHEIALTLVNNSLSDIESNAFAGISDRIYYINLEYNNFTHLPAGLGNHQGLVSLKTLLLSYNPLKTLDGLILHSLGRTLQEFSFGMVGENWPTSIQELRHVTTLQVGPLSLSTLPDHAFIHMPLVKLTFAETNLEAIPPIICRINQLRSLEFNTTNVVDFAAMVPHCATGGHHYEGLHSLTLAGTDLYELPLNIFSSFPHLTSLRIYDLKDASSSNINSIQFPSNNKIRHLGLDSDNLVSIPRSITTLPHLQSLDLTRNQIQCGCLMAWMLQWEGRQNVNITGECENYNMSIAVFIETKLRTFCH